MTDSFAPPFNFPPNFREEVLRQIFVILKRGESLQLIGLPGFGKTNLLNSIILSKPVIEYHLLSEAEKFYFLYFDCNLISEKSTPGVLNYFSSRFTENHQNFGVFLDNLCLTRKVVVILDSFENLIDSKFNDLYKILTGIYNQHRFSLSFIFSVNREITSPEKIQFFNKMAFLISENLVFLPPLSKKDSLLFTNLYEKQAGIKISPDDKNKIVELSGGIMRTIKRLVKALATSFSLKELSENPAIDFHLAYPFEEILESLKPEQETLKNIISAKRLSKEDKINLQKLEKLYIIDKNQNFISPLFEVFLKHKYSQKEAYTENLERFQLEARLTANEYKILKLLTENPEKIYSREEIIRAVWGENAGQETSNHALDQLIHRLRDKLKSAKPTANLETIRGRGHRLVT